MGYADQVPWKRHVAFCFLFFKFPANPTKDYKEELLWNPFFLNSMITQSQCFELFIGFIAMPFPEAIFQA